MLVSEEVERAFDSCRVSDALLQVYRLFWDDFSGWLLELLKPARRKIDAESSKKSLLILFDTLLGVLRPSSAPQQELCTRWARGEKHRQLTVQPMPKAKPIDAGLLAEYEALGGSVGHPQCAAVAKGGC